MSVLEKVGLVLLIELVPVRSCVQVQLTWSSAKLGSMA